jgi:hypothetical protein
MRWFEQHRMEWIAETLHVFGFINREHLMRKFGVSTPQASVDLNRFMRMHPDAMRYDQSAKRYVAITSGTRVTTPDTQ